MAVAACRPFVVMETRSRDKRGCSVFISDLAAVFRLHNRSIIGYVCFKDDYSPD